MTADTHASACPDNTGVASPAIRPEFASCAGATPSPEPDTTSPPISTPAPPPSTLAVPSTTMPATTLSAPPASTPAATPPPSAAVPYCTADIKPGVVWSNYDGTYMSVVNIVSPQTCSFVTTWPGVHVVFCQGTQVQPSQLGCWGFILERTSKVYPVGTQVAALPAMPEHAHTLSA